MPRGWIHQACTLKHSDEPSLHLTVSAMQQWAWADLLDIIMPEALDAATMSETSTSLRQGMPRGFLDYMGAMHDTTVAENIPDSLKDDGAGSDDDEDEDDDGEQEARRAEKMQIRRLKLRQKRFRQEAKKRIMKVAMAVSDPVVCFKC